MSPREAEWNKTIHLILGDMHIGHELSDQEVSEFARRVVACAVYDEDVNRRQRQVLVCQLVCQALILIYILWRGP
jgi:hypothetical protein